MAINTIILNKKILKEVIDESIRQNKEILLIFFSNNEYMEIKGETNRVGDLTHLLTVPGKVSLIFHTHLPSINFQNKELIAYPSAADVEMSIFLSKYQFRETLHAIGSLIDGKYIVCYWSPHNINFSLLNSVEYRIFNGEINDEIREALGKAIGLQCLDLDSISLTIITEQEEQNFYRKIDALIRENDTVIFRENIDEIREVIERMYPVLEKYYDYVDDIYEDYKGIVYVYYLLLSISGKKIRYAKMMVYGNKKIIVTTMTASDENIIRIGNKEYRLEELKELCKGYCNQE